MLEEEPPFGVGVGVPLAGVGEALGVGDGVTFSDGVGEASVVGVGASVGGRGVGVNSFYPSPLPPVATTANAIRAIKIIIPIMIKIILALLPELLEDSYTYERLEGFRND